MRRLNDFMKCIIALAPVVYMHAVQADTIQTSNGATLIGMITNTTIESVTMQTDYAGTLTVARDQITEINKDSENADVVQSDESNWTYSVSANMNGRQGNVETIGTSFQGEAIRATNDDKFKLYASIDHAEVNDEKTTDEKIAGASFVSYVYNSWGWFASTELEQDLFENIDLRASVASGLSYRILNKSNHSLEIRTGVGYRHEAFLDHTSDNTPTLDFGLNHEWAFKPFPRINPWLEMSNILSFTPSVKDFSNYLVMQDTGINMPIGTSKLKMRMGIKNNYDSQPVVGREELDTTYYSRLLLDFN